MFNNLKAEFVRIGIQPHIGIANALECSERVARNRLGGNTDFSVMEAVKIKEKYFPDLSVDYLFSNDVAV